MEIAAQEFLRSVRATRSQVAFARKLGYQSNPIADWEAGRRFPTAQEAMRACELSGIDVVAAFSRFHKPAAPALQESLSAWLRALKGGTPIVQIAKRMERSRYAVSRWLSGKTKARLPDFFRLLEALTGRLSDLIAQLVPMEEVPALAGMHSAREAARGLAFKEPWTEAILRVIETPRYRASEEHRLGWIAKELGINVETETRCLDLLSAAGVIAREGTHYRDAGQISVDTSASPEEVLGLKLHWSSVAQKRMGSPGRRDVLAYNVVSLSSEDYERVQQLLRSTFREIRTIVAGSTPTDTVALLNVQWMEWPGPASKGID